MKERKVMKRLYEQYSESLKKISERLDEVGCEMSCHRAKSEEYKTLYNRRRRLLKMYEDTYLWREMVKEYINAWEE